MNISAWAIRQPIPSIVLFIILTIWGLYSFRSLGIDENPNIDLPIVTVTINQVGAAPSELETQVTRRVEDAVAGIGGIKHITSTINEGISLTSIEFELGTDSDRATNDVRDAVTRIRQQLPPQITEPIIQRVEFVGGPFNSYTVSSPSLSIEEISWLIDNDIARAMLSIPGVGQVQRSGGADREIRIELDPVRLEAVGLSAEGVNQQIRALNINLPGGRGEVGSAEQSIRTLGSARTLNELKTARLALPRGGWVRLDTVGKVLDVPAETRQQAFLNGKPAVSFSIVRSSGGNMVAIQDGVDKMLAEMKKNGRLPPDVEVTKIRSNAKYVLESYSSSVEHLLLGATLAVIVIWWFLRDFRAAVISALAMPLSMIPTFGAMKALGFTLNNLSLLGLSLVIGILVDDAIVEIENIVRHIHMGKKPYQASLEAADEIGLAVVATTATIIVVFVPVAFMGGIPGQFFKQFGLTVALAVFFSLLVARLITPMMAAYWMDEPPHDPEKNLLMRTYDRLLLWCLANRGPTVVLAVIFFVFSLMLFPLLPQSLVSSVDRGEAVLSMEAPPGVKLEQTTAAALELSRILLENPAVQNVFTSVGAPSAGRGRQAGSAGGVNRANIYVILKPKSERPGKISQQAFEQEVRPRFAEVAGVRTSFGSLVGLSNKLNLVFTSDSPEQLESFTDKVLKDMRQLPILSDVQSQAALLRPEVNVIPDMRRASEQGVSVQSIARTAQIATLGDIDQNLAKYDLEARQINIRVQLEPRFRTNYDLISQLKVPTQSGKLVPLESVADIKVGRGPSQIDRYDRARQVAISASLNIGTPLGDALKAVHALPVFKEKPKDVRERAAGDVEIQRDVFAGFFWAMGAAVLLIYAVLVLLFADFLHPITIMVSLPLSIGGALFGLLTMREPLGMYALIGIVMLMGLVTKNAILLVDYILMALHQGATRHEAVVSAGEARMRPILMTTIAMIAGMVPIALGMGAGAEVRKAMAIAVIGGLITSTALTLLVVPAVFTYVDDAKLWIGRMKDRKR